MFKEILDCLFAGMGVGFLAFSKILPVLFQLNNLKWQIIAAFFGIPVAALFLIRITAKIIKYLKQ